MKRWISLMILISMLFVISSCSKKLPMHSSMELQTETPGIPEEEIDMSSAIRPATATAEPLFAAPLTPEEIARLNAGTCFFDMVLPDETVDSCFFAEEISDEVFARMDSVSYKEGCPVLREELSYCRVLYTGFDGFTYIGELVVNDAIAGDVLEIFRELYDARYAIGKMVLIDDYGGDDNLSMADNNTSAFNFRIVNHTTTLSRHAFGMAIDINPLYNPWIYVKDGKTVVDPPAAAAYADRSVENPYYLTGEDLCTTLFLEHGFSWGGDWEDSKDYQHFSKAP